MEWVKYLHVVSGIFIAFAGLFQIVFKKGGRFHRSMGTAYFFAWPLVVATGAYLGHFLIAILGALGFYMAYTGYIFGHRKQTILRIWDKVLIYLFLLLPMILLVYGIYLLTHGNVNFGIILSFFGLIFFLVISKDINGYIRLKNNRKLSGHKMEWFFEHFGRMYISYIAAMTAFTVIQNPFPISVLNWILPTIIGTALISISTKYYKKKHAIGNPE